MEKLLDPKFLEAAAGEMGAMNDIDPEIERLGGGSADLAGAMDVPFIASAAASLPTAVTPAMPSSMPQAQARKAVDPATIKHYICLYPCYFNPKKKTSQGRKLPLSLLEECADPHPFDIAESCAKLGFTSICIETKRHPKDWEGFHNRVRVELKDKTGKLTVDAIPTKEKLLVEIAKAIPTLPNRKLRLAQFAARKAEFEARKAAAEKTTAAAKKPTGVVKKKGK